MREDTKFQNLQVNEFRLYTCKFKLVITVLIIAVFVAALGVNSAKSQDLVPPPPLDIPPLISETYSSDEDGSRIPMPYPQHLSNETF